MIPKDIASDEELGRLISQKGNTCPGGRWRLFRDRHKHISVDRISVVEIDEAIEIAKNETSNTEVKFHGWLVMRVVDVLEEKDERKVSYEPTCTNILHTHIILPDTSPETRLDHAHKLADYEGNRIHLLPA